jgi:hypothetical protein
MSNRDPELRKLFDRMRTLGFHKNLVMVTAKAKPMTPAEIEAANQPRFIDYIGIMK